jgi:chemotaxis protein methyltransferase CheR
LDLSFPDKRVKFNQSTDEGQQAMDDHQFQQLLDNFEYSWRGYRRVRKGVKKRIRRHMQQLGCRTIHAYLQELDQAPALKQICEQLMTVSISRFFRDRHFWRTLETRILPDAIRRSQGPFKVWSAGCACGEEAYTFRLVWDNLEKNGLSMPELNILATDMNPDYLRKAEDAVYPRSSLKEIEERYRSVWFDANRKKTRFTLKPGFKNNIVCQAHHLLHPPPDSGFNIIFLRNNLLTYYQDNLKIPAFYRILKSLEPSGILVVGANESIPDDLPELTPIPPFSYVFRRNL